MPQVKQLALFDTDTQNPSPSSVNTIDAPNGAHQAITHAEASPGAPESGDVPLPLPQTQTTEEEGLQNSALDGLAIVATRGDAPSTLEASAQDPAFAQNAQAKISPRTRAHKSVASKATQAAPSASRPALTLSTQSQTHRGLTVKQVAALFSVSVATIWSWSKYHPEFPKPAKLSEGVTRWRETDIIVFQTKVWGE